MIDTAGTICDAAKLLKDRGAKSVSALATHGIFSGPAPERINNSDLDKIYITDTVPLRKEILESPKLVVISVAKLLAEAINCIYNGDSISEKLIPKSRK